MSDYFEFEARRKIYELLKKNPGLHLSKIAEILNLRISHVEYHLLYMEKNDLITSSKEKGYKRYYISGSKIGLKEKKLLSILRQEKPLKIVLLILKTSKARHQDLINEIDVAPSTLSYHLKKLVNKEILTITVNHGDKEYSVLNEKEIIQFIIKYKPYEVLASFIDIWTGLTVDWKDLLIYFLYAYFMDIIKYTYDFVRQIPEG